MPLTAQNFADRISRLRADLGEQARRVRSLIEGAFDAAFARDAEAALRVIEMDEVIDRVDVDIEKASVSLLTEACGSGATISPDQVRMVLTIVKVNNELERIADAGVVVAELVKVVVSSSTPLPDTLRVITNSVVGILRDAGASLERLDGHLAKVVLASEDAVEAFKDAIVRDMSVQIAAGRLNADRAFLVQEITTQCEIMAGHCTNIAEQALYVSTGKIVRHMHGHWEEVPTTN
jgi:phosphate transport system protein